MRLHPYRLHYMVSADLRDTELTWRSQLAVEDAGGARGTTQSAERLYARTLEQRNFVVKHDTGEVSPR
jgi:hypothetical protein